MPTAGLSPRGDLGSVARNPLLLHTNMDAGHGGQSGRFRAYKEIAMEYAFLLDLDGKAGVKVEQ